MTTIRAINIIRCLFDKVDQPEVITALRMSINALKSKSYQCEFCEYCDYIGSDIWVCNKKEDRVARNGICQDYVFNESYDQ